MRLFALLFAFAFFAISAFSRELSFKINNVLDGDTVVVSPLGNPFKHMKIRVWGIDTPEKYDTYKLQEQAQKCGVPVEKIRRLGEESSQRAKMYLSPGLIVSIEPVETDMFGRLVAKVYINGRDYGLQMVREGYACVYWGDTSEEYIRAMKEAKRLKKGLWFTAPKLMDCLCSP